VLGARDLGRRHDGKEAAVAQPDDGRHRPGKRAGAAHAVVRLRVRVVEADPDLERVGGATGERGEGVGHGVVDERAIGEHGGRGHLEGIAEQGEHLGVEKRLTAREVDLFHAQVLRLADGAAGHVGMDGPEPGVGGAAGIDAVDALEVAPRSRDLDPEGGEAQEGRAGGVRGRGRPVDHRQAHRSVHVPFLDTVRRRCCRA